MQLDVIHMDADKCLYHDEQHELMLYLSISLIKNNNQQCLGKYGLSFFWGFFFRSFFKSFIYLFNFACIFAILHRPIKSMGNIFQ